MFAPPMGHQATYCESEKDVYNTMTQNKSTHNFRKQSMTLVNICQPTTTTTTKTLIQTNGTKKIMTKNKDKDWEEQEEDYTGERIEKEIARQLNKPGMMKQIVGTLQANNDAKITQEIERQVSEGDLINHLLSNLTQHMYKEIASQLTPTIKEITNHTTQLEAVSRQLYNKWKNNLQPLKPNSKSLQTNTTS
jgi:hypothetical protein